MRRVLILTQPSDMHAPPVMEEIHRRGAEVLCFDLADFPEHVSLDTRLGSLGWEGTITHQGQTVALQTLKSVWWRRPQPYTAKAHDSGVKEFLEREAYRGIIGTLEGLEAGTDGTLWVSRPECIRRAELKSLQLVEAQKSGLRTPRTLLTNDPNAVRNFYEECLGKIILKAVSKGIIAGLPSYFCIPVKFSQNIFPVSKECGRQHICSRKSSRKCWSYVSS